MTAADMPPGYFREDDEHDQPTPDDRRNDPRWQAVARMAFEDDELEVPDPGPVTYTGAAIAGDHYDLDAYPTRLTDPDEDEDEAAPIELAAGEAEALARADWHLERIAAIRAERAVVEHVYREAFDRLTARYHAQLEQLNRDEQWHAAPVIGLHGAILAANPKRKTIRLPHGALTSRTPKRPRFDVVDREAFIEWARSADTAAPLYRTTYAPAMTEIAGALEMGAPVSERSDADDTHMVVDPATGEVVPGVIARPPTTSHRLETT